MPEGTSWIVLSTWSRWCKAQEIKGTVC